MTKGWTIIFYRGGGGVLPFLGLADNFFSKQNAFQTIFSITSIFGTCRHLFFLKKCASKNFFLYIYLFIRAIFYDHLKKRTGFFIDLS